MIEIQETERNIENALMHLLQASAYFDKAGLNKTAVELAEFANVSYQQLKESDTNNIDSSKLTDDKYDDILADILKG